MGPVEQISPRGQSDAVSRDIDLLNVETLKPVFEQMRGPSAGIAEGRNGELYISADAEGSVLELRPVPLSK